MLKDFNAPTNNNLFSATLIMKSRVSALESLLEEIKVSKCTTFDGVLKLVHSSIYRTNEIMKGSK